MVENKSCGNCEHYHPNSNIDRNYGTCKEYEALVNYNRHPCNWYCKKAGDQNAR